MKKNIGVQADFYLEIIILLKLYLVSPATNAVSEISFFNASHLKMAEKDNATRKIELLYAAFNA